MSPAALLLFGALASAAVAADTPILKLVQNIPLHGVKGRFDHFAIDVKGQRLFVAALGNNTLEVIDLAAGKRLRSLSGMSKPTGVLFLPKLDQILVANGDEGTLKLLNGADFEVLRNLTDLADADNIRFDPKSKLAWLGYGEGVLAIVDTTKAEIVGRVRLPAHPESFQLETTGRRGFVNVPDARQVAVIDRVKPAVIDTWPMEEFQANFPMALDETNHRLFLGCRQPPRLVVLDATKGRPVANLAISGDVDDLFYDGLRKRLYLSCGEGFLDIIQQTTADNYTRASRLPTAAGARTCYFSPVTDRLYLAVPDRGSQSAEICVYQPQ